MCKDTIEEKIVALQKRKSALAANVLTGYDLTLPVHSLPICAFTQATGRELDSQFVLKGIM